MRIIGGTLSGRKLVAPSGDTTRPTSDRVREALFNRLVHAELPGDPLSGPALDLYAGSGGLGLEALSRGAPRCDFVDDSSGATIQRNIDALGLGDRAKVHRMRVDVFLKRAQPGYALVLVDPPYADAGAPLDRVLGALHRVLLPDALVVVEHAPSPAPRATRDEEPTLALLDQRSYGQTVVSFLTVRGRGTGSDP